MFVCVCVFFFRLCFWLKLHNSSKYMILLLAAALVSSSRRSRRTSSFVCVIVLSFNSGTEQVVV